MRSRLALVVWLACAPAAYAATVPSAPASPDSPADWRRDGVDDRVKPALTGRGWRFEDDGRALNPATKEPATKAALDKAVLDLRQDARRAALESVNLMLASGKPLGKTDRARIEAMAPDLPPALTAALLDPKSDMNAVKTMAGAGLAEVAAYFDGVRTMADRRAAVQPVFAGTPGPRVPLPYFDATEKAAGEKLRAAAQAVIGKDPFGKTVLARLNGKDGKPDLPPVVIEDKAGSVVATYDFRRGAVVLDRESVLSSVVGSVPAPQRSALRRSLTSRAALLAYLDAHPEAVQAVVADNDVVLVHELTHAWQDRRDPLLREIARGNLPDVQPLEYEEEAYKTKNWYIHSKVRHDPSSVKLDQEFDDYLAMMRGAQSWRQQLVKTLRNSSPSRALGFHSLEKVQQARLARARGRSVSTSEEQEAKSLDLLAMGRAGAELSALGGEQKNRMTALDADIVAAGAGRAKTLGAFYYGRALDETNAISRAVLLDKAAVHAEAAGDAALLEKIRRARQPI